MDLSLISEERPGPESSISKLSESGKKLREEKEGMEIGGRLRKPGRREYHCGETRGRILKLFSSRKHPVCSEERKASGGGLGKIRQTSDEEKVCSGWHKRANAANPEETKDLLTTPPPKRKGRLGEKVSFVQKGMETSKKILRDLLLVVRERLLPLCGPGGRGVVEEQQKTDGRRRQGEGGRTHVKLPCKVRETARAKLLFATMRGTCLLRVKVVG